MIRTSAADVGDRVTDETVGPDDERLLGELRGLFQRAAPMPPWLVEAARQSYGLRRIDAELADLTRDSLTDEPTVLVRGDGPSMLTFDAPDLTVEVELTGSGRTRRLTGQLVPPQPARVEVRQSEREAPRVVDSDIRGRFSFGELRPGPLSLACHRPGLRTVATEWIRLD